ncbi:MAG: GUN4 domain-containing protein [Dolichospermum sp. DET50]|nr:GUN4 domain-containing protein [Dolichospermum sp. DET66]MBS3031069.1 GUN4 domain-containing protein [Dolichospermum sp. DET67]MBS3036279.1 GUN4 domain-containing protein [Dolichospermum sp. DET50]QSX68342.1 MAG: GUN4 domain-containing protein [Dolichospermum sp. DET69]
MKVDVKWWVGTIIALFGTVAAIAAFPEGRCLLRLERKCRLDYSHLEKYLKKGQQEWKQAEQETTKILLQAAEAEKEQKFDKQSWVNIDCSVLKKINNYWETSNDQFGFKKQREIWEKNKDNFPNNVGWRQGENWLNYPQDIIENNTTPGHFPAWTGLNGSEDVNAGPKRFKECSL